DKFLRKIKQMGSREIQRSIFLNSIFARNDPIASHDLFVLRIPGDQLIVTFFAGIVLIEIHFHTSAATRCPEGQFPEPPDLLDDIRGIVIIDEVNEIVAVIGIAEESLGSKLLFQQAAIYS